MWARLREILDGLLFAASARAAAETAAKVRQQRADHAANVGSGLFGDAGKDAGDIAENFHAHRDGAGAHQQGVVLDATAFGVGERGQAVGERPDLIEEIERIWQAIAEDTLPLLA